MDEAEDDQGMEDGVGEISDCESESCAREPKESSPKPTTVSKLELYSHFSNTTKNKIKYCIYNHIYKY